MPDHHKKKRFLNLPKYPGGNDAFRKFIAENLCYPEAALEARVTGTVIVEYDIHDDGVVHQPRVIKGIGYDCDEEALRVVGLLRYEKVKNRGLRVKMTSKTNINFRLPGININYSLAQKADSPGPPANQEQKDKTPVIYQYTVNL